MTAAYKGRNTPAIAGTSFARDVAANVVIQQGTIVVLAAGFAAPGSTALNLVADGRAREFVNNTARAAGSQKVTVEKGCFRYANSVAGDAITRSEIGKLSYVVDDQTVAKTDGGGTRSVAGTIMDVDAAGVWVRFN